MEYTFGTPGRGTAATQAQNLNGGYIGGPTTLQALLLGAGGRSPFDPSLGYAGGNMAEGGQPPNVFGGGAGAGRRAKPKPGSGMVPPFNPKTPLVPGTPKPPPVGIPGQMTGMPTVFNPGQIDPSKIGQRTGAGEFSAQVRPRRDIADIAYTNR